MFQRYWVARYLHDNHSKLNNQHNLRIPIRRPPNEQEKLQVDNDKDIRTSSENYEERGCGLDLNLLIIFILISHDNVI